MRLAVEFTSSCFRSAHVTLSSGSHSVFSFAHSSLAAALFSHHSLTQLRSLSTLVGCIYSLRHCSKRYRSFTRPVSGKILIKCKIQFKIGVSCVFFQQRFT